MFSADCILMLLLPVLAGFILAQYQRRQAWQGKVWSPRR